MTKRTRRTKEETREALINATLDLCVEIGVEGLTTGKVAKRAGVSQPTFYLYFDDMDDALRKCADHVSGEFRALLRDARENVDLSKTTDMESVLRVIFNATFDAFLEKPERTDLFLRYRRHHGTPLGDGMNAIYKRAHDELHRDMKRMGLTFMLMKNADLHIDYIIGDVLVTVEALLDKKYGLDKEQCLDHICELSMRIITAAQKP